MIWFFKWTEPDMNLSTTKVKLGLLHARNDSDSLSFHSVVGYLEFQYFSISSAVLPGILPAIRDHLIITSETWDKDDNESGN